VFLPPPILERGREEKVGTERGKGENERGLEKDRAEIER
jgi:hypothetical protein